VVVVALLAVAIGLADAAVKAARLRDLGLQLLVAREARLLRELLARRVAERAAREPLERLVRPREISGREESAEALKGASTASNAQRLT